MAIDADLIRQVANQVQGGPWRPESIINSPASFGGSAMMAPVAPSSAVPAAARVAPIAPSSVMSGPAALSALGGISGARPQAAPIAAAAAPAAQASRVGMIARAGGLGRVAGGAGAGMLGGTLASSLARQLAGDDPNSRTDDMIANAAGGAVAGGTIGATLGAPFFGVGAVPAGLAGAAIGGLGGAGYGYLTGGSDPRSDDKLRDALLEGEGKLQQVIEATGLSEQGQNTIRGQLAPLLVYAESADQVKQVYDQVGQIIPQVVAEDQIVQQQQAEQLADQQHRAAQVAAITSMLGPQIAQQQAQATQYASDMSTAMRSAAARVQDPALRAIYEQRAAQVPMAQSQANLAQLHQMTLGPAAFQAQADMSAQLAEQQQQAGNPGFAAGNSVDALLAQLTG